MLCLRASIVPHTCFRDRRVNAVGHLNTKILNMKPITLGNMSMVQCIEKHDNFEEFCKIN